MPTALRTLVWFRGKELRVADHAPLHDAAKRGEVVCLFVLDPYFFAPERARKIPHRMQFLLESIASLAANLEHLGSRLVLVSGKSIDVVPRLARAWRADRVVAHRWTEPFARKRDEIVKSRLHVPFALFEGETLASPGQLKTREGSPYSVFTPFARAHRAKVEIGAPLRAPRSLPPLPDDVAAHVKREEATLPTLAELGITHNPGILVGGESAARARLRKFLEGAASEYEAQRNRMDLASTSHLSADFHFGTLSCRNVWRAVEDALAKRHSDAWKSFSNELLWRELAHSLLFANPTLLERPHRRAFEAFPWQENRAGWKAWIAGETGYPVVDAAARQLLGEGFVHNRARMISASFLTKDLLISYQRGEAHYLEYLTDGDWAQNNAGWQWTAGCGFDAQPYYRVFNPIEQGRRYDPTGAYVRTWVPELAKLPEKYMHDPWNAPEGVLREAGVVLGKTYPHPVVDHAEARARFLAVAAQLKKGPGAAAKYAISE